MSDRVFSFEETPDSRAETFAQPSYTLRYVANGEPNNDTVANYALANTPQYVIRQGNLLVRKDLQIDPDGWGIYRITVPYGKRDRIDVPKGSFTFNFDTTGATVTLKAAKEHVASFPDNGDWHKGAIGVGKDGEVEGVEVVIPALQINYSFKHPAGVVDEAFARYMSVITGHTNAAPWRGFAAGELLFLGASGSDGTDAEADVNYSFVASGNSTDLSVGDITSIVKQGHHYAWVEFEDDVASGEAVRPPKRVHIERVYDAINFYTALGWQ